MFYRMVAVFMSVTMLLLLESQVKEKRKSHVQKIGSFLSEWLIRFFGPHCFITSNDNVKIKLLCLLYVLINLKKVYEITIMLCTYYMSYFPQFLISREERGKKWNSSRGIEENSRNLFTLRYHQIFTNNV